LLASSIDKVLPHIGEELIFPTIKETSTIEYGGISGYFPGPSYLPPAEKLYADPIKHLPSPIFNYPASPLYTGFEGPYSPEYSNILNLYKHSGYYGLPSAVENIEEIVIDKPISAGLYGYPSYFGQIGRASCWERVYIAV
jgi:hypothetical protein